MFSLPHLTLREGERMTLPIARYTILAPMSVRCRPITCSVTRIRPRLGTKTHGGFPVAQGPTVVEWIWQAFVERAQRRRASRVEGTARTSGALHPPVSMALLLARVVPVTK